MSRGSKALMWSIRLRTSQAEHLLCAPGQLTWPHCASVCLICKMGTMDLIFPGC